MVRHKHKLADIKMGGRYCEDGEVAHVRFGDAGEGQVDVVISHEMVPTCLLSAGYEKLLCV